MTELNIDFETASQCNLLTEGVYNYAMHPSTEILMMYWAFDDEEPVGWFPGDGVLPMRIVHHILDGGRINAANAAFERLIWWYVMPKYSDAPSPDYIPKLEQFYCTLYKARCNNMPASLEKLCRALGTFDQKAAAEGKKLINLFSILDENNLSEGDRQEALGVPNISWCFDDFCDYCAQDVRAERDAGNQLREPTEDEWEDYFINERINDRGVKIDIPLAQGAQQYAQAEEAELVGRIIELTDGEVEKARGGKLKDWVMERLNEDQLRLMVKYGTDSKIVDGEKVNTKVKKYSLDKHIRQRLLSEEIDDDVAEVIECSDFAQKSSVSKFGAMLLRANPQTKRVSGAFMGNGAAGTGRFSSKGLQVHNFPRTGMELQSEVREDIVDGIEPEDIRDYFKLPIMEILSRSLRSALIPSAGNTFLVSDWSAVEGRVAPWLCKSRAADKKLQLYVDGVDTYINAAQGIYYKDDIDKDERQVGKVAELSLQFGGGANAFLGMARNYGISMGKDRAEEVKTNWRAANPWAKDMWGRCEAGAFSAITSLGTMFAVGRVTYFAVPDLYGYDMTLFCQLPCGRVLTYPDIKIGQKKAPWGDMVPSLSAMRSGWTPKQGEKKWPRGGVYGGLLFENIVQGTAASLLRWALAECDYEDLPVVLHVHDEIVLEAAETDVEDMSEVLGDIMNTGPKWSEGLPLAASVETMKVYGK
jgi:DNA polymerase